MKRELIIGLALAWFTAGSAGAECAAGDDPCAPKKVIGAWDSGLAAGFNLSRGNSDTLQLTLLGRAYLERGDSIWEFNASYAYTEDSTDVVDAEDETTQNDLRANGSYKNIFSERVYWGFATDFRYDEIADIDYRVNLIPNIGYFFLKDDTFKLSADIGPGYIFEKVGGVEDDYFAPRIGERFDWVISCTSKFYQLAEFIFDVNDSDNYLLNGEIGIEADIAANLALVVMLRDNYDNQPAAEREKNDLALISALKVKL